MPASFKIKKPEFFIVGTMKGGTTILYDFICMHPDVKKAKQKEIHYFSLYPDNGLEWYISHFDFESPGITGEASPTYFDVAYTSSIPKAIKAVNPDAKIILITRDPVERAVSHFFHLKTINKVPLLQDMDVNEFFSIDFDKAISQSTDHQYYLNQVLWFSFYSRKLNIYRQVFSKDKIIAIDNDQLRKHPQSTMGRVFGFLGLHDFQDEKFNAVKYSSGKGPEELSLQTRVRLAQFFYSDYAKYCQIAGIPYVEKWGGNRNIDSDVLVGRDGWLFLAGGSNKPLSYYEKESTLGHDFVNKWISLLQSRKSNLGNVQYLHVFIPNKETIYPEKACLDGIKYPGNPLSVLYGGCSEDARALLDDVCIDPREYFGKIRHDYQLYWKTDSHWSPSGCYAAYQLICAKLGISPIKDLLSRPFTEGEVMLDLGGKLAPPVREKARYYNFCKDSHCFYENEMVSYKKKNSRENDAGFHVGSFVKFRNDSAACRKKILIFGDSFAEYRPALLTGMLAETFLETYFVWSTSLDYSIIKELSPDIVLTDIAERFMPNVPSDTFDLHGHVEKTLRNA